MKKLIFGGLLSLAICGSGKASTNFILTSNAVYNMIQQYGAGSNYVAQFMTVIPANATTATIQTALNAGGVVYFTPSANPYTITTNVSITNGVTISGNGATVRAAAGLTNAMLDFGTNSARGYVTIENLNIDGNVYNSYGTTNNYFRTFNGVITPFYNPYYSNRTGLRISVAGGVTIRNCRFFGWPGNAMIIVNTNARPASMFGARADIYNNLFYTNFVGITVAGNEYDNKGYYNNSYASEPLIPAEYQGIRNNTFYRNYIGLSKNAANGQVMNNYFTGNSIGMVQSAGDNNSAHDMVQNNTFNHNSFGFWSESNNGGIIANNIFLANDTYDMIINKVTELVINGNRFGHAATSVIISNLCTGTFYQNWYQGSWATWAPVITNTVEVWGNRSYSVAGDSDGGGYTLGTNYNGLLVANTNMPRLVMSNKVLYLVTNTKTNLVSNGE